MKGGRNIMVFVVLFAALILGMGTRVIHTYLSDNGITVCEARDSGGDETYDEDDTEYC